jgi:soluble lytic murein transglycosylase-like protein
MQVLSSEARAGHSDAELLDPLTNVRAGVGYLKRIARAGDALPELASKYNAGQDASGRPHLSAASPWGMREQPGYIESVARASNYATTTEGSKA